MWAQVEQDLANLLSSKLFPGVQETSDYKDLLQGGHPDPAKCKAKANEIVNFSELRSGIREFGSREAPKVQEWTKPICRAISANGRVTGPWWFDEELVQRWSRSYPPGTPGRKQAILESIRPMLAVCFDWNAFTDLLVMRPSAPIPVITGQGAHKPIFSPKDPRHAPNSNVLFIGGFSQVYVPFVNVADTSPYSF